MKNVITKFATYKNYGLFKHIYLLDVDYTFNEKSVEDIMEFIKNEPFFDVMIHTNDISHEVIRLFKEISKYKNIWLQSDELYYEEFGNMNEDTIKIIEPVLKFAEHKLKNKEYVWKVIYEASW